MKRAFEMTMRVRFCLSYDRFKLNLTAFKVNIISIENTMLSRTSLWCTDVTVVYAPKCYVTSGWPPSDRNKISWLFTDFSLTKFRFTDQNTAVLRPICLLAADKWQIPFTSSLKCTSLILQMKQIKSLNSFLAQNILKLITFHSFEWAKRAREKHF